MAGPSLDITPLLRRELLQQVRPVASDDGAYLVIDLGGLVIAFFDLPADNSSSSAPSRRPFRNSIRMWAQPRS
jgi:hypothetical protein